jgi:hypothetical protein
MWLRRTLSGMSIALLMLLSSAGSIEAKRANAGSLSGIVESGGKGLAGYEVSLYARFLAPPGIAGVIGRATTGPAGEFRMDYRLPKGKSSPLLFIRAASGPAMLASALGQAPIADSVVVNERTTVATGFSYAQFLDGAKIDGNRVGMINAARMSENMVQVETGALADVLRLSPNGSETSALPTFNSVANMVAFCTDSPAGCRKLIEAATPPGGPSPPNVLQAVANIAKYPWLNVDKLFALSLDRQVNTPALTQKPDAWTLFLKFTGSFSSRQDADNLMNGPGAFAIDGEGNIWASNNYVPEPPLADACPGTRLLKFYPWGENFPGSPYFGGGLSGAGWGITLAPNGLVWVGNFGFTTPECPPPPADSVSLFRPDGKPLSGENGFTERPSSWPPGPMSDLGGNIWIANCRADSVTVYPDGRPDGAFEIPIPKPTGSTGSMKPFGIAIDKRGNSWVTGSLNSTLAVIGPRGKVIRVFGPRDAQGRTVLRRPMGVASDSRGNIWVANSDFMDVPCPPSPTPDLGAATAPSVALFFQGSGNRPHAGKAFAGGGLAIPWGIAVDGNDTVWVANFGFPFTPTDFNLPWPAPNRVSHFCGADPSKCPPTKQEVGKAISPDGTGYTSDALIRNTAIAIDPSGNVWLANNWKEAPVVNNPGGNSIVVLVGAAAPVKTPLIGTPRSFGRQ